MSELTRRDLLTQLGTAAVAVPLAATLGVSAQKPTPIKLGQIGVAHAHASKLSVYRKSPDYEVVGIVEPDAASRKRAEAQNPYRDLRWLTRDDLLGMPGLQAVLVETRVEDLLTNAE